MDASLMCSEMPCPTEHHCIDAWKKASKLAEKQRPTDAASLSHFSRAAVQCHHHSSAPHPQQSSSFSSSSLLSSSALGKRKRLSLDEETATKKTVLEALQATCDLDFLRKHHLNGSLALILKNKNKQHMIQALHDWNNQIQSSSSSGDCGDEGEEKFLLLKRILVTILQRCKGSGGSSIESRTADHLEEKLSKSHGREEECFKAGKKVTILLLHEDYPVELPVFGHDDINNASASSLHSDNDQEVVLCVLGAVRDMSSLENKALLAAAAETGVHCVVANLGRTAEFTSKIIMALSVHALCGRLLPAVRWLESHQSKSTDLLAKAPSTRESGITWDGYQVKKRLENEKNGKSIGVTPDLFVVVVKLSLASTAVSLDQAARPHLLELVQLVVNTLWKSRMVSSGPDSLSGSVAIDSGAMVCELFLYFNDGVLLKIDQKTMAKRVEAMHCPAPSEQQILTILVDLLRDPDVTTRLDTTSTVASAELECAVFNRVLREVPAYYVDHGRLFILQPSENTTSQLLEEESAPLSHFVYMSDCSCSQAANECTNEKQEKEEDDDDDDSKGSTLILSMNFDTAWVKKNQFPPVLRAWYSRKYSDRVDDTKVSEKVSKRLKRLSKQHKLGAVIGKGDVSSAHVIALLQHWAYHGRLFPALRIWKAGTTSL